VIRRLAKTLDGQVDEYARLVDRGNKLVAEISAIRTDDAKAQKLVETLNGKAKESATKLGRNFAAIKKMLAMAHEKEKDPRVAAMTARWAEMESWLTTQREVLKARVKQMQALVEVAEGTGADGDKKTLDQALDEAKQRATWRPTLRETGDKYTHFLADIDKVLGKDLQEQLQRDLQRFKGMVSAGQARHPEGRPRARHRRRRTEEGLGRRCRRAREGARRTGQEAQAQDQRQRHGEGAEKGTADSVTVPPRRTLRCDRRGG